MLKNAIISVGLILSFASAGFGQNALTPGAVRSINYAGRFLFAVGDRGLIYRSGDHGKTWKKVRSGSRANLQAIAHDGNRTWLLGGVGEPGLPEPAGRGVILQSLDEGETFTNLSASNIGWLYGGVISSDKAFVIGQAWGNCPAGIFYSPNAGGKFIAVRQKTTGYYLSSCFYNPKLGFMVGPNQRLTTILNFKQTAKHTSSYNKDLALRAICRTQQTSAIAVGENGLVLTGKADQSADPATGEMKNEPWKVLQVPLPQKCRSISDFETVDARGNLIVIAGGLIKKIVISRDKGKTYKLIDSPANAPIRTAKIARDNSILLGTDAGQIWRKENMKSPWQLVAGKFKKNKFFDTNLDVLFVIAADDISLYPAIVAHARAKLRVGVLYASCRKSKNVPSAQPLRAAALSAGACAVTVLEDFAIDPTGKTAVQIKSLWRASTDQSPDRLLPAQITAAIRLYKPAVVVTASTKTHSETGSAVENALIARYAKQACKEAGDASKNKAHKNASLNPHDTLRFFEGHEFNSDTALPWQATKNPAKRSERNLTIDAADFIIDMPESIELRAAKSAWLIGKNSLIDRPARFTNFISDDLDEKVRTFTEDLPGYSGSKGKLKIAIATWDTENLSNCTDLRTAISLNKIEDAISPIIKKWNSPINQTTGINPKLIVADRLLLIYWQLYSDGKIQQAERLRDMLLKKFAKPHPLYKSLVTQTLSNSCSAEYVINANKVRINQSFDFNSIKFAAKNFPRLGMWAFSPAGYLLRAQAQFFTVDAKAGNKIRGFVSKGAFPTSFKEYSGIEIFSKNRQASIWGRNQTTINKKHSGIIIDGLLSEKAWLKAPKTKLTTPTGTPAELEKSAVRILRSGDDLTFGFALADNPKRKWNITIAIDSDLDSWSHFVMEVSSTGEKKCYLKNRTGPKIRLAKSSFKVQAKRNQAGYLSFEISCPISNFANPKNTFIAGLQIRATATENNISKSIYFNPSKLNPMKPENFGLLKFFSNAKITTNKKS